MWNRDEGYPASIAKNWRGTEMRKFTLTGKLTLGGILAVLIPVACVGVLSIVRASSELERISRSGLVASARDHSEAIQLVLDQELNMVKAIALSDNAVDAATQVVGEGIEKSAQQIDSLQHGLAGLQADVGRNYEFIVVADPAGKIFADSRNGKIKGLSIADRDYFKTARDGKPCVGSVVLSKTSGKPILPLSAPIFSRNKEVVGVAAVIINIDYIVNNVIAAKTGQTGYAYIVDRAGLVIAHPVKENILKSNIKDLQGMEELSSSMLAGKSGALGYEYNGVQRIAGYAAVPLTGWSVIVGQNLDELKEPIYSLQKEIVILGSGFLLLIAGLVFFFGRRISRPIVAAADGLLEAADQVSSASTHVSSASQQLAEGASEQAAGIEETSSSLEEMASMTRQNSDNANQCKSVMQEARQIVGRVNEHMSSMAEAIANISSSSEETVKIVKTIDEIAFQTNLLALNAAVEAARAGEAGAGFAVVADEVRNLAMRAAEAAKNTTDLIDNTIKAVKDGSGLMDLTTAAFQENIEVAGKIDGLVGEIAAASQEQAQGIEQISKAVSEMDQVVQRNAANAEESASASEELNAQAGQMKQYVEVLVDLVGKSGNSDAAASGPVRKSAGKRGQVHHESLPYRPANARAKDHKKRIGTRSSATSDARPERVIPFDDDSFGDF